MLKLCFDFVKISLTEVIIVLFLYVDLNIELL